MKKAIILLALCALAPFLSAASAVFYGDEYRVLQALTGTPRSWSDRDEETEARNARLRDVSRAIDNAGATREERAALLAVGECETLWAGRIGRDECEKSPAPDQRCDPDKNGKAQALGYWQLHRSSCPEAWGKPPTPERLLIETECAVRVLRMALRKCKTWERAVTGYRGYCELGDSVIRARSYRAYLHVLEHGWPKPPKGWQHAKRVARKDINLGVRRTNGAAVGAFAIFKPDMAAFVEWHWHDPSGKVSPKGWHRGVTFFERSGQ